MRWIITTGIVLLLVACSGSGSKQEKAPKSRQQKQKVEQQKKPHATDASKASEADTISSRKQKSVFESYDYKAPYICPNHCEGSGSDKPGKCPVCGMELIKNPTN